jgi:hypothetical protein
MHTHMAVCLCIQENPFLNCFILEETKMERDVGTAHIE